MVVCVGGPGINQSLARVAEFAVKSPTLSKG
jgi:hypothetical protein